MNAVSNATDEQRKMDSAGARRDMRRTEDARLKFWHAAIVSSFFIIVVGASLFLGLVMMLGKIGGNDSASELTADGRTGRFARTLSDGIQCHYMVFDNKTGQTVEDRIGRCDEGKPKPKKETPPVFVWGGK